MTKAIYSFRGEHRWLSNFFRVDVVLDGVTYRSVEHAFQAAKTLDAAERAKIAAVASPMIAKRVGKKVTLRAGWNTLRLEVMRELVRQKFAPGTTLAEQLLATDDAHLEEGNRWGDRFWGTVSGQGENHLGRMLMELREELQQLPRGAPAPRPRLEAPTDAYPGEANSRRPEQLG